VKKSKLGSVKYLLLLLLSLSAVAQVTTGALTGRVTDPSGAAIPNSPVVLEDPARAYRREVFTGADGRYVFPQLPAAAYRLTVSLAKFAPLTRESIEIAPGQTRREDVSLRLAGTQTGIEVADSTRAASESAQIGLTLDAERIKSLPLNRRDFLQLALLAPGIAPPVQDSELSSRGAFAMHASGAREEFNQYLLDGVDNNDPYNGRFVLQPPVETIQEFRVETNSYGAEFGRSAGGQINIVTRSGSNVWHGEAFEYFRNRSLDARNYFESPSERARYQRNQYGGALGGPVRQDKAYFYANFGGLVERRGFSRLGVVPSPAERRGDLSGLGQPVIDPFTQRPFPGNIIPPSRIHPLAGRVLDLFPQATVFQPVLRDNLPQGSGRLDTHGFNFRYSYGTQDLFEPYAEEAQSIPGFGNRVNNTGHNAMAHHTHAFSPHVLHSLRAGFTRSFRQVLPENNQRNIGQEWGVNWLNVRPRDYGYPLFNIQGYSTVGDAAPLPIERRSNTYQITESLQIHRGRHLFKLGADLRRQEVNGYLDYFARGQLIFGGALTGTGIGDLLLGFPQTAIQSQFDNPQTLKSYFSGFWFQDDWKVTPRLTLNFGLRYEYFQPPVDRFNRMSAFDPATGTLAQVGTNGIRRSVMAPDRNNFAPRLGLAYSVNANTVIRAGYGIFYDAGMFVVNSSQYFNPPYFNIRVWFPTATSLISLTNPFPSEGGFVPPATLNTVSPDAVTSNLQHWSFSIERQIGRATTLSVGYVGSKGFHLVRARDLNQPLPGPGNPQENRPQPRFGGIFFSETGANSSYHSLQLNLNRRLARGVSVLASYTYGKSIDDTSSFITSGPDKNFPQNSRNYRAERARSSFDMRQRFAGTATWTLPGTRVWTRNFELRGIFTAQTGQPFSPYLRFDNSNTGNTGGTFGYDRPDLVGDANLGGQSAERWFNTAAFAVPAPYRFGNAGRNILTGPALATVDSSVARVFSIQERYRLTASFEAFNLLNRTNFQLPERFLDEPSTFGRILSARSPRQLQLSLRFQF
jgi:hypothetical protein